MFTDSINRSAPCRICGGAFFVFRVQKQRDFGIHNKFTFGILTLHG